MEEILIERTINLLREKLNENVIDVWNRLDQKMARVNPDYKATDPPLNISDKDFYRFNLDEVADTSNKRIIVGADRGIVDATNRGNVLSQYTLEIMFMYETGYQDIRSRIYIPLRYRDAIIQTIETNYREITSQSSWITMDDIGTVESDNDGNRSIISGISYQVIA